MRKINILNLSGLVFAVILSCTMCKKDDIPFSESDVIDVLEKAGKVYPLAADKDEIIGTTSEAAGAYRFTYVEHDVIENIQNIASLGMNEEAIWPGSLVKGNRFHDFIYPPISVERAPLTLSATLADSSPGSSASQIIDNPTRSTISQGVSNLLAKAIPDGKEVSAKIEFSYQQVFSKSHMSLILGSDILFGGGNLDTLFNWEEGSTDTRILAIYRHNYYTIETETPDSPMDFFNPSLTKNDLATVMEPGSCPIYVSGLTYGMMAVVCIESANFNYLQIEEALEASYAGNWYSDLGLGYSSASILGSCIINIVVYGGSAAGLNNLEKGFNGYKKVISANSVFTKDTPGVPLEYSFKNLIDNTPAVVTLHSQHTSKLIKKIRQIIKIQVKKFTCHDPDDGWTTPPTFPWVPYRDVLLEIDRLKVFVSASSGLNGPLVTPTNQVVYSYSLGGDQWISMGEGDTFPTYGIPPPPPFTIEFNIEYYDFNVAIMKLSGEVRDWDSSISDPETAIGEVTYIGEEMIGSHVFNLHHADFNFDVLVEITKENK